jgi:acetylornithine deacetylase
MDRTSLLSRIDAAKSLEFLAAMIRHKSYSGTPEESLLSRFMVERMKEVRALRRAAAGARQPLQRPRPSQRARAAAPRCLFNGHLDTNPVTEGWTVDPWGGLYDKDFIYGIGVSNMKAGDAAYFCALHTLMEKRRPTSAAT